MFDHLSYLLDNSCMLLGKALNNKTISIYHIKQYDGIVRIPHVHSSPIIWPWYFVKKLKSIASTMSTENSH